jgi:hypothetical protein
MSTKDLFPKAPREIRTGAEHSGARYVRKPDYYAMHDQQPGTSAAGAAALLNEGTIAVFQGLPNTTAAASTTARLGPVYALQPGDLLAIPTGLIFVRFPTGTVAASRGKELAQAGYELVEIPSYAPQAAWVRSRSGQIADSLANVSALEQLPDVENIEPQMLMERHAR